MKRAIVALVALLVVMVPKATANQKLPCSPPTAVVGYHSPPNSTYVDVTFNVCGDYQAYNVYQKVVPEGGRVDWFERESTITLPEAMQFQTFQYLTRFAPGNWYVQLYVFQGATMVAFAEYEFTK